MLSPSPFAEKGAGSYPPPPAYIRLPQGAITYATRAEGCPHVGRRSRKSAVQRAGLAYQRKVESWLAGVALASADCRLECGPWFYFLDSDHARHYCQPDALFTLGGNRGVVVVEIKLRWTTDAWWQLRELYLPVLSRALPGKPLLPLCITRSYDPAIRVPEPVTLLDDLCAARPDKFNVLVWKP